VEDSFIKDLCSKCTTSEAAGQRTSRTAGCACLMLGNLAVTDDVSTRLASDMVPVSTLLRDLGSSNDSMFLNAAAGLLRHLAIPMENRELFFGEEETLQQVAHLYTDVTLEQVQVAGLQLTRQVLANMAERTQRFIEQHGTPSLDTVITLFKETTSTATRLEVSRLLTVILRALQSPSSPGLYDVCLRTLVNTPDVLLPAVFAIRQSPAPNVLTAQAEAWLTLNLFVRAPGGAVTLATQTCNDEELLSLLRQRIKISGNEIAETVGEGAEAEPQDTRPRWVKDKERDNAVLLVHDLLKADDVEEGVKHVLRSLLEESDIRIG